MRIIIDLQGAQAENRQRGIGRYTISLAKAIIRNAGKHEIMLALNGSFPETIEQIRADFADILPQENIRIWYVNGEVNSLADDNLQRRKVAELIREAFLFSLKPDVLLVTSLFEGLVDNSVTSIGLLSCSIPTATILYDLIPFINRKVHFENPVVEEWYEDKLDHLRRSDLLLAISESSRQEGLNYLGFQEKNVVNISAAADRQFHPQAVSQLQEYRVRERYTLYKSYVMYTGGVDYRKNVEALIRSYAKLPKKLRNEHQLAIVCSIQDYDRARLEDLAKKNTLKKNELIFTGYIPEDDLLTLYRLCKVFIFPSLHEGFGLPVLEAMSCGRAVLGANTSGVPEVIGLDDALFDPTNDNEIMAKLLAALTDDKFRARLEKHSLKQAKKFSWDNSAIRAINAFEELHKKNQLVSVPILSRRPKMAFLSPFPPERSGISNYSIELLPELSRHYDIDVIVGQDEVATAVWVKANCQIRDVPYFTTHANDYDRVLYHFGNSCFHQHMFSLLEDIPGVVVLHDFFLSGIIAHMDVTGYKENIWVKELYNGHGYTVLRQRFHAKNSDNVIWKYPCNHHVISNATGIIVHAENSKRLAGHWNQACENKDWAVIPHLRNPVMGDDSVMASQQLSLNVNDFVVCSFGVLGPTKLNHRLLESWIASDLAKDKNCILVFVGGVQEGEYCQQLLKKIKQSGLSKRIRVTGWTDKEVYKQYLLVADAGVQLRTNSRGETSGAVLDCMNYSLATIVNENGSMVDLPDDVVYKIPDEFTDDQLTQALNELWKNPEQREKLGQSARISILKNHSPRVCAEQYFSAVEKFEKDAEGNMNSLIRKISKININNEQELLNVAESISRSIPPLIPERQLFVDVSELIQRDNKTGIQRVVKNILHEWLMNPPNGVRIEPVYATVGRKGYRYARKFTMGFVNCPQNILNDEVIDYKAGDIFIGLDLQHIIVKSQKEFYQKLRRHGVQVKFVVYDLLCILMPQHFIAAANDMHTQWLEVVVESDGAICISNAVAEELRNWLGGYKVNRPRSFDISWFHLGADFKSSMPTQGQPDDANKMLKVIQEQLSFLMVGTIEPRKGHAQTLAAFEQLWRDGVDVSLIIVGKQGWMVEELVERLHHHPELGERLFWLKGISDEYLEKVYSSSSCLIAASEGEGFGLPLIEAAQHKLPIIARDIPVFRETAGEYALYFQNSELVATIEKWLALFHENRHRKSDGMPNLSWQESAKNLLENLLESPLYMTKKTGG